jgi:hypothetical protein
VAAEAKVEMCPPIPSSPCCPYHHGHGVPAHQALDAALDLAAAGVRRLLIGVDGVDVGGVGGERQLDAAGVRVIPLPEQLADRCGRRP